MGSSFILSGRSRALEAFNRAVPWYRLPKWLALANLSQIRKTLREENLHDTNRLDTDDNYEPEWDTASAVDQSVLQARTADGTYNDLEGPRMGAKGMRFGRNIPLAQVKAANPSELLTPNPRTISETLLARREFVPATSLNVLACAWIQFMTRDWFSHGQNDPEAPYEIGLREGDSWPTKPMRVQRTRKDVSRCPMSNGPPTFTNDVTHWWDASQVYGSDAATQAKLRTYQGGKLKLSLDQRLLTDDESGAELTGFITDTNWAPLTLLHTIFAREHNSICDALSLAYPTWKDEELFARARLVNAALLAKIHTVEWTPALLSNPTTTTAMYANWWGVLGKEARDGLGRVIDDEVFSGIPGGSKNHFGVPYAITEEFVAVYRLHSLVPDSYKFWNLQDHEVITSVELPALLGLTGTKLLDEVGVENALYSFGISNPGALRLHNYPNHLRKLERHDNELVDLATIDLLRDRERGVPRYNDFRELLHLPRAKSFAALTDNPQWAKELQSVYKDVDQVDLLTGTLVEPLPPGMAFGDTQFRIFVLMASRRLNSDRFFTSDFNDEVYSKVGMSWVRDNTMTSVILRHYPALSAALNHVSNPFAPWNSVNL